MRGLRVALAVAVVVSLAPPAGCHVRTVTVKHDAAEDPTVRVEIASTCPTPTGELTCLSEWIETRDGRQKVSVMCNAPSMWEGH